MARVEQNRLLAPQTAKKIPNKIATPSLSNLANRVNKLLEEEKQNAASPTSFQNLRPSKPSNLRALGDRVFAQLEEEEELAKIAAQIEEQELTIQEIAPPINPRRICGICGDPNCPYSW